MSPCGREAEGYDALLAGSRTFVCLLGSKLRHRRLKDTHVSNPPLTG